MLVKSADHGNDVVVLLFCSFFVIFSARDSPRKFNEIGRLKNCELYCKKQIYNNFPWSL